MKVVLKLSQVFQVIGRRREKLRDARERKRVQQVAELVRKRESDRKRRAR
jgi:hypothetical protein